MWRLEHIISSKHTLTDHNIFCEVFLTNKIFFSHIPTNDMEYFDDRGNNLLKKPTTITSHYFGQAHAHHKHHKIQVA